MKDNTFYFSHDYNARTDSKIKKLIRVKKMEGYGIFWAIVEDLYNNANALQTDYDGIAFDLHTDSETIKSIINDFDLFIIEDGFFGSQSVERRLSERNDKSEKARKSAFKRWSPNKDNAKAMRTQCEGNAIKESKVNDIKLKESKEDKEKEFRKQVFSFNNLYSDKMLLAFFNYWSEKSKSGKMRWEMEKTYEISKRLNTWKSREKEEIAPIKGLNPFDLLAQ
jgi:CRISPR/Cas system-associated protein endoribonuclease Cas2